MENELIDTLNYIAGQMNEAERNNDKERMAGLIKAFEKVRQELSEIE